MLKNPLTCPPPQPTKKKEEIENKKPIPLPNKPTNTTIAEKQVEGFSFNLVDMPVLSVPEHSQK